MSSINKIYDVLIAEKNSYFSLIPVLFGVGIVIYFKFPFEPNLKISALSAILLLVGSLKFRKTPTLFWILIISIIISSGFLAANIKSVLVNAPVITTKLGIKKIYGTIESISERKYGKRFVLTDIEIKGLKKEKTPLKIRINVKTKTYHSKIGDRISVLANLSPPPKPIIPGGYDFSRYAYFQQIGAVGFAVSDVELLPSNKKLTVKHIVENIRQKVKQRILHISNNTSSNIAVARKFHEKAKTYVEQYNF